MKRGKLIYLKVKPVEREKFEFTSESGNTFLAFENAGVTHTRLESDKTVPTTDTLGPNTHDTFPESPENPTPLIVNSVPPVNEPTEGATDCTEADCLYVKFWPIATDPALETVAMTTPATWGGDTHIT